MPVARRALITGIAGQDGSYLAEFLLEQGYQVAGIELVRSVDGGAGADKGVTSYPNLKGVFGKISQYCGSIDDAEFVASVVEQFKPTEIYHLAAATFVSFDSIAERDTLSRNILGFHNVLSAVQRMVPQCKVFFAGSSEMFGNPGAAPQTLETPFAPRSVYGIAKLAGFHLINYYRTFHRMFAVCGVLYNHESPRRGSQFVTQKIVRTAARIKAGLETELVLGNLDAMRDWSDARDFVRGFWMQMNHETPRDFIFASGKLHSVREFVDMAFGAVGLSPGDFVKTSPEFFRPAERVPLQGDSSATRTILGWEPRYSLEQTVADMVRSELGKC